MAVIESAATVGIPSSIGSSGRPRSGVTVHYVGASSVTRGAHTTCRAQVRGWHAYHRTGNGWAGLGYHYCVCHHGIVMTGRGLNRVGAHAPGANATHVGVLFMLGGSQTPTAAQLKGFREFLSWLAARGVRTGKAQITPHSRWISTSCPGTHLRGRVSSGNWGTGGTTSPPPAPSKPGISPPYAFPLAAGHWFGPESADARNHSGYWVRDRAHIAKIRGRLRERGWAVAAGDRYDAALAAAVRAFQSEKGLAADGLVGARTWPLLWTARIT